MIFSGVTNGGWGLQPFEFFLPPHKNEKATDPRGVTNGGGQAAPRTHKNGKEVKNGK